MKVKFKNGITIEVLDSEGKSKKEIIKEMKNIYKQMKDANKFIGLEKVKELSKKGDYSLVLSKGNDKYLDEYLVLKNDKTIEKIDADNTKSAIKQFKLKFSDALTKEFVEEINNQIGGKPFELFDEESEDTYIYYVELDIDGKLYAGPVTNSGIIREFDIVYDNSKSLEENLNDLYEEAINGTFNYSINDSKKPIKDAWKFNEEEIKAMTDYFIKEGIIEEGQTLQDAFNDDLNDCLELVYWGTQYENGAIDVMEFKKGVLYEWCDDDIFWGIIRDFVNEGENAYYSMDEFNEIMSGYEPHNLALTCFNGNFNPNHEFFTFNGYANLDSFDDERQYLKIYKDEALDKAIKNEENIDCDMYRILCDNEQNILLLTYFIIHNLEY